MFQRLGAAADTLDDISRIETLVRQRFDVGVDEIVLVSQDPGIRPGFPPEETNVLFWKKDIRYRLKVFAPVHRVSENDLPVKWLLPMLEDTGEAECC